MSGMSCCCFECVTESEAGVLERCGKHNRIAPPGCFCVMFPFEKVVHRMSMKVRYLEVKCETKTKDNVFVGVVCAILYNVLKDRVNDAYYKLTDVRSQITSYVFDVVRSTIPRMDLDEAFASKDQVAVAIKEQLTGLMIQYGFEIKTALVIDLDPNSYLKASMNDINAQSRLREANKERADGEKILMVKAAEADAEARYLSGLGVAKQRKALMEGLKETVSTFSTEVHGTTSSDVMNLLLVTQYFDMIKELGNKNKSGASLFLPHGPSAVHKLRNDLMAKVADRES